MYAHMTGVGGGNPLAALFQAYGTSYFKSSGRFRSFMEYRVMESSHDDALSPSPRDWLDFLHEEAEMQDSDHRGWIKRDEQPGIWNQTPITCGTFSLDFKWNNCGGQPRSSVDADPLGAGSPGKRIEAL
jgi:hypothetical protein